MKSLEVKVKKLREDAIIPKYQTEGAAGFDFHAAIDHDILLRPGDWREISFGIAMEIPSGYELRIRSRSGLAFEHLIIAYHGLIDSDYRGPLSVLLHNASVDDYVIKPGDRVVVVDDLIATGGTMKASADLIEELGGKVIKMLFLLELEGLEGRKKLEGYDVESVVKYPGK